VLNATANFILTRMGEGARYDDALAEAQAAGLAERDPAPTSRVTTRSRRR